MFGIDTRQMDVGQDFEVVLHEGVLLDGIHHCVMQLMHVLSLGHLTVVHVSLSDFMSSGSHFSGSQQKTHAVKGGII